MKKALCCCKDFNFKFFRIKFYYLKYFFKGGGFKIAQI